MPARSLTVLIVEDHDDTRSHLREIAKLTGLAVITQTRVESAINVLAEADMMIVNWHLPDADTEELLDFWFRTKTGPVAVLYTEMPDPTHARLLARCTTWNVIPQPANWETLENVISALLQRYSTFVRVGTRLDELTCRVKLLTWGLAGTMAVLLISIVTTFIALLR